MTDKELRKLRRDDLLQILIDQQKQIEELTAALQAGEKALEDKRIALEESGTLAEAALRLNQVFTRAQNAADQYVQELRERSEEALTQAQAQAERILAEARRDAERIRSEAELSVSSQLDVTPDGGERRGFAIWRKR